MQQNSPQISSLEDEIDLFKIAHKLAASKKLIIIITLLITILGSIYSYQRLPIYTSTALIEIGSYDKLIEPVSTLVQELNINFIHKQNESLNLESIENRLIKIITVSPSSVENEKKINRIVDYIEDRHSKLISNNIKETEYKLTSKIDLKNKDIEFKYSTLLNKITNEKLRISSEIDLLNRQIEFKYSTLLTQSKNEKLRISSEIDLLNRQIEFKYSTLLTQIKNEKLSISSEISKLENQIPNIDLKILELNSIINQDQKNLLALKSNPELFIQRAAQSPTLNQVIFTYKLQLIQLEAEKIDISQLKDNLEFKLQQLESKDIDSGDIFKLSQAKDNLEFKLQQLTTKDTESADIFKLSQVKDNLEFKLQQLTTKDTESADIFELSQVIDNLELELEFLKKKKYNNSQLIGGIQTSILESNKKLVIFFSFIIGLFFSIIVVFINEFLKTFKNSY